MTREEFDKQIGGAGAQALDLIWGGIWVLMAIISLVCVFAAPGGLWPGLVGMVGFGWLAWRRLFNAYARSALLKARDAGELEFDEQAPQV